MSNFDDGDECEERDKERLVMGKHAVTVKDVCAGCPWTSNTFAYVHVVQQP